MKPIISPPNYQKTTNKTMKQIDTIAEAYGRILPKAQFEKKLAEWKRMRPLKRLFTRRPSDPFPGKSATAIDAESHLVATKTLIGLDKPMTPEGDYIIELENGDTFRTGVHGDGRIHSDGLPSVHVFAEYAHKDKRYVERIQIKTHAPDPGTTYKLHARRNETQMPHYKFIPMSVRPYLLKAEEAAELLGKAIAQLAKA